MISCGAEQVTSQLKVSVSSIAAGEITMDGGQGSSFFKTKVMIYKSDACKNKQNFMA